jgi:nitrite reductase (NADH) large subunit
MDVTRSSTGSRPRLVVVGNGMVGHRFVGAATERGLAEQYEIVVIGEEPRLAYDRVGLSKWFEGKTESELSLVGEGEYDALGVRVILGNAALSLDRAAKTVRLASGEELSFDKVVLATGSSPFVPPIPGRDLPGCFVYRTIDDLIRIRDASQGAKRGAVIGGGLLGLEAANALLQLGLETRVVEFAPRLMPLQVDEVGGAVLKQRIEELGVVVHTGTTTREILRGEDGRVAGLRFSDGDEIPIDVLVFSAGIRPRDELARAAGITLGERGGIAIDGMCRTNVPDVFAIGECAVFSGRVYGLVAPGYRMAEVAAAAIAGEDSAFEGFDTSTKLKLLGVDVGSFGDAFGASPGARVVSLFDGASSVYKKLVLSEDKKRLLGGMLVGDADSYTELLARVQGALPCPDHPEELIVPPREGATPSAGVAGLPDAAMICSCHNVSKGSICGAIREKKLSAVGAVKSCTKAGTGCGSCVTLVDQLLKLELKRAGVAVKNHLCEHFPHSRQELFHLVLVNEIRSFEELIERHGKGD